MGNKARPRFPEKFVEFLEEKKERPNQPNIEVLSDKTVLDELEDRIDEFVDKEKDDGDELPFSL